MQVRGVVPLYPPYSLVGSWLTTHEFLRDLAAHGHQVSVTAYLAGGARPTTLDGVAVHPNFRDLGRPDVVIGHLGDDGSSRVIALRTGAALVVMAHGGSFNDLNQRLKRSSLVVFNSEALRDAIAWPGPHIVARPPVDPDHYRTTPGDRVTLINLSETKGVGLFWELAKLLPQVPFLGVRGNYGAQVVLGGRPNVAIQRPTSDMATDVYRRTRILLLPSIETFGRVGLEAGCSGIPTIAHPCPGIREALGDAAIYVDRTDTDGWRQAIEHLGAEPAWRKASKAITQRLRGWHPADELTRFRHSVEEVAACALSS
jgi:glycosyltransferase involved in cell wall biosynthesis